MQRILVCRNPFGIILGLYGDNGKNMETTVMGYVGFRGAI